MAQSDTVLACGRWGGPCAWLFFCIGSSVVNFYFVFLFLHFLYNCGAICSCILVVKVLCQCTSTCLLELHVQLRS